jgi:hypothetical protein
MCRREGVFWLVARAASGEKKMGHAVEGEVGQKRKMSPRASFLFSFFFYFPIFQFQLDFKFKQSSNLHTKKNIFQHECKVHALCLFIYLLPYLFI